MTSYMERRAKEITDEKKQKFEQAKKEGNYGKANAIKNELVYGWGENCDEDNNYDVPNK